jgi:hypothetical protein
MTEAILKDRQGRVLSIGQCRAVFGKKDLVIEVESLEYIISRMGGPEPVTVDSGHVLVSEPDPRTVKCPQCPHPASDHSDAGCLHQQTLESKWRSPGATGVCKCALSYAESMKGVSR